MWKWFAIIGAGAAIGYAAVYFALSSDPTPEPEPQQSTASAPAPQPADPVMLPQVVDVTETDSLLDPQPTSPTGIPFDPTEPLEPQTNAKAN